MKHFQFLFCLALYLVAAGRLPAAYTDPAISIKVVSSVSNAHQPILTLRTNGPTTVTLVATAANFSPTNFVWSEVADTINSFASAGTATFSATHTSSNQVVVKLPAAGGFTSFKSRRATASMPHRVMSG
jgi:hypothetical protein